MYLAAALSYWLIHTVTYIHTYIHTCRYVPVASMLHTHMLHSEVFALTCLFSSNCLHAVMNLDGSGYTVLDSASNVGTHAIDHLR